MAQSGSKILKWDSSLKDLPALGFLELSSISRGLFLTDVVLKKAPVKMIASQPISSGKHILLFFGDAASVEESYHEALRESSGQVLKQILIHSVHPELVPFLDSIWERDDAMSGSISDSVGIVESATLAGAILSADRALKTADVTLARLRLGQGIGGKAYFVISGKQEAVEAALDAAQSTLKEHESLVRVDVIPRPEPLALGYF